MPNYDIIFSRTSPLYKEKNQSWCDSASAYDGGEQHIKRALIKHQSETNGKFDERKKRAFYLNYPRKIANLITNYLFSTAPTRDGVNIDVEADFDRLGRNANEIMRQVSLTKNIFRTGYVLVENVAISGNVDLKTKKEQKLRPYVRVLNPFQVTDYCVGEDGLFEWCIVREEILDNKDPLAEPVTKERRRLWTRKDWKLFEKDSKNSEIKLIKEATHALGMVPIIQFSDVDSYTVNNNIHWFEDLVRISNAILNNGSEAQMNIIMQMFGMLIVPESFAQINSEDDQLNDIDDESDELAPLPSSRTTPLETDESEFAQKLDRFTAIVESAEEKGTSRYISPGGAENKTIREENVMLKNEMFDIVGLALQSSSNAAQSGYSKSWDHLTIAQGMAVRAASLQQLELQIWEILHQWDKSISVPKVTYNSDFAIKDIATEVKALMDIASFQLGDLGDKTVLKAIVEKLNEINPISNDVKKEIFESIDKMTPLELPQQRNIAGGDKNVDD
ncbi:hypothetical protein AAEX28_02455 [Lentisphaerota bacterium WC36G]|nr:phage portal protein [Lentisphaerae bacterium WC36]